MKFPRNIKPLTDELKDELALLIVRDDALFAKRMEEYRATRTEQQKQNDLLDSICGQTPPPDLDSIGLCSNNVILSEILETEYNRRDRLFHFVQILGILNGAIDRETGEVCDDEWGVAGFGIFDHLWKTFGSFRKLKETVVIGDVKNEDGGDWFTKEFGNYHVGYSFLTAEDPTEACCVMFTIWSNLTIRECQKTRMFIERI